MNFTLIAQYFIAAINLIYNLIYWQSPQKKSPTLFLKATPQMERAGLLCASCNEDVISHKTDLKDANSVGIIIPLPIFLATVNIFAIRKAKRIGLICTIQTTQLWLENVTFEFNNIISFHHILESTNFDSSPNSMLWNWN